jgi:hypothetical protein
MQLDTDEGEAFVPPAGVVAAPHADQVAPNHESTSTDLERLEANNEAALEAEE